MNHQNHSVFLIVFILVVSTGNFEYTRIDELIFLPFWMLFVSSFSRKILFWLMSHKSMLNLRLHIFCLLCLIYFLLLNSFIIDAIFSIVPVIFCLFLSLLPSPGCILIVKIHVFHVFYFIIWFAELRTRKNLCRLILWFLTLFYYRITSKYYRARTVWSTWFLRTMWMFWFAIVSGSVSWRIPDAKLWIKLLWSWISVIFSWLWVLSTHSSFLF